MKSERRHELQHNQLADALAEASVKVKPYSRTIGGVAVILCVLLLAYTYVSGKGAQKSAVGWDEYFEAVNANDRERLTEVAEKYAGTSVAPWARIVAADMGLSEGCSSLFNQKAKAREMLRQAVNNYQTVFGEATDDTLKQRALYGLGRGHEALASVEDLKKAREDYKKLLEGWPEGVYSVAAKQRLDDLERSSTKEFYDWFAKHEPPKAASPSGKKPEFLEDALDSDVKLPTALDELDLGDPKSSGKKESGLDEIQLPEFPQSSPNPAEAPAEKSVEPATPDEKPVDDSSAPAKESPVETPADKPAESPKQ